MPNRNFSKEQVQEAIKGTAGIMSTVASRLQCDWHTAQAYVNKWECTKRAFQDEAEKVLDLAETKLIEAIKDGDTGMIKYLLSTKGKGRGFTERTEITGEDGGPIEIRDFDRAVERAYNDDDGA